MRWLVGAMTALLLGTLVTTTVAGVLDPEPGPSPAPTATVTTPTSTTPTATAPGGTATAPSTTGPLTTAPASTTANGASYTVAEVAQHASVDSCWLIVSAQVYDVTTYLRAHPGGSRTITPWCGRESTEAFATEDGEGEHSDDAYALLEQYWIGEVTT